jgi:predicted GIY-YIG superfamily endonuclease
MYTYIATNTLNGKFYIGSAIDLEKRKRQHLKLKSDRPFHRDLQANPEVFTWDVFVDEASDSILEHALLEMWHGKEQCYNIAAVAKERGISIEITDPHGETTLYSSILQATRSTGIKRQRLRRWLDGFPGRGKWNGWSAKEAS